MVKNWHHFLLPYHQAVAELMVKLNWLKRQFNVEGLHNPIQSVTGRVKPVASIIEKMRRRYIAPDRLAQDMEDIAGLRIVCPFIEDIYYLVKIIRKRTDMNIVEERDYVRHHKASGYRSYHIIFTYRVQTIYGTHKLLAEIQIRTLAMDFWSTVEHSLRYKQKGLFPKYLEKDLQKSARISFRLDQEMSRIRRVLWQIDHQKSKRGKDVENRHF